MPGLASSPNRVEAQTLEARVLLSPPSVIGGAVIRAARRSARISRRRLARTLAVSPRTVRRWENGTCPLFSVRYDDLCRVAAALDEAGAKTRCDAAELVVASQCDLLLTGMLEGFEDYAEVPPVDENGSEGEAARGLLRWALTGVAPERCRPYAPASPLLVANDIVAFTTIARNLNAGSHGEQLVRYGAALTALTADLDQRSPAGGDDHVSIMASELPDRHGSQER